jgi:hypothetical protein
LEILFQNNSFSTVKIASDGQLQVESAIVSTDYDAVGQMRVGYRDYRIIDARWEIGRSPGRTDEGCADVPGLAGVEAYLEAGPALRREVGVERNGVPLELLSECVKAVLQAESFMYFDRGYPTARSYEEYWDKMYVNSCRYYSNLDRVKGGYLEEETNYRRTIGLFNRFLVSRVIRQDNGSYVVSGGFCDSAHELSVSVDLDQEGIVSGAAGNYLRAPEDVCRESNRHIAKLLGQDFTQIKKKEVGGMLGGSQGCVHLVDLVFGMAKAFVAAQTRGN